MSLLPQTQRTLNHSSAPRGASWAAGINTIDCPHSESPGQSASRARGDGAAPPAGCHQRMLLLAWRPKMVFRDKGPREAAGKPPAKIARRGALSKHRKSRLLRERPKSKGQLRKERLFSSLQSGLKQSREAPPVTRSRRWEPAHGDTGSLSLSPPLAWRGEEQQRGLLVHL